MSTTVYLHGLPGGADELHCVALPPGWDVPDRLTWRDYPKDLEALARALPDRTRLVGFSLGTMTALRLAALCPDRITAITLVSAAAPLELGDFLPRMSGAPVFRAAMSAPRRLAAMTAAQGALTAIAPGLVLRLLFAGTGSAEQRLASVHSALLAGLLRRSYGIGRAPYLVELRQYVRPWADLLAKVTAPVTLHVGTADRWSPPDMSEALQQALPEARVIRHDGLGHYGTLAAVLGACAE